MYLVFSKESVYELNIPENNGLNAPNYDINLTSFCILGSYNKVFNCFQIK